jgi:HlyD family secretion protein
VQAPMGRPHHMRPMTMVVFIALSTLCAAIGLRYWQGIKRSESLLAAPKMTEVKVELRKMKTAITATGTIRPRIGTEVRVGTQISGIVSKLLVTVGSHIDKGEMIAEIDSRGLDARIAQARSQIKIDQAAFEKVERDFARSRALSDAGLIPRQQTEELEEDRKGAGARLEKSQSDLAVVESDLPYLVIRAPISGTVSAVSTQQGETVAASFSAPNFVTLMEDKALELVAMVDETDIANVRPSDPVAFTTETYPAKEFAGVVERVAPKATIVSGVVNYEVGIAIRVAAGALKPDMTANVTIQTAERRALMIPNDAVQKSGDQRYVYVARSVGPEKRDIVPGQREGSWIEAKQGLNADDKVLLGYSATDKR